MDEGLEDSVNGGLRDVCLAMDCLESHRLIHSLKELKDVDRFRQYGDEIKPLRGLSHWCRSPLREGPVTRLSDRPRIPLMEYD